MSDLVPRPPKTPAELSRQADHIWHVWMNKYSTEQSKWPHSLYEFKSLLEFLQWGWKRLEQAFTANLPTEHQQCSLSPVEPIKENILKCCLGAECVKCDILLGLKATFDDERNRTRGVLGKFYDQVPETEVYKRMANTCAWHIYTKTCGIVDEGFHGVDTTEGHLMDTGDRMYWDRLYQSLSQTDDGERPDRLDATPEGVVAKPTENVSD